MTARSFTSLVAAGLLVATPSASAVSITVEFENIGTFFGGSSVARAAVEKAAADISAALTNSMNALTADTYTGVSGGSIAQLDFGFSYLRPSTGSTTSFANPATVPGFGVDEIRIYTGMRALDLGELGRGGIGGGSSNSSFPTNTGQLTAALANAETAANLGLGRGSGPVGTIRSATITGVGSYSVEVGIFLGSVAFTTLSDFHLDAFAPVEAGKFDLYTVALHEMLHSLGFGNSVTHSTLASGVNWSGAEAVALAGRSNILTSDSNHIADDLLSTDIYTGDVQIPILAEDFSPGTRRFLTQLDLAFLRDLNYTTIPEPSSLSLVLLGMFVLFKRRR